MKLFIAIFIVVTGLIICSCHQEKPETPKTFSIPDPKGDLIKTKSAEELIYIVETVMPDTSGSFSGSFNKVGDTLRIEKFDSNGRITFSRSNTFFPPRINYYYDENGFVRYKSYMTDYMREWHVATFIDSTKRIGYQKWFDRLGEDPQSLYFFNANGLPDSAIICKYDQSSCGVRFKVKYVYEDKRLMLVTKSIFPADSATAKNCIQETSDSTIYQYKNNSLTGILKKRKYKDGNFSDEKELFEAGNNFSKMEIEGKNYKLKLIGKAIRNSKTE